MLFVTIPFSQRVRSSPVSRILARVSSSYPPPVDVSAWNSSVTLAETADGAWFGCVSAGTATSFWGVVGMTDSSDYNGGKEAPQSDEVVGPAWKALNQKRRKLWDVFAN